MKPYKKEYFEQLETFVDGFYSKNSRTPTILEIESELGIPKTTVDRYLRYMSDHGMLKYEGRKKITTKTMERTRESTLSLPVLGAVSCGIPKYAEENIEEYVRVPVSWFGTGQFFALRADGESMIGAGIDHGDLVVVRQQNYADPGQIIVALIDNEDATLKRFRPHSDGQYIDLVPENDKFKVRTVDLSCETLEIQGVAVKVLKDLE